MILERNFRYHTPGPAEIRKYEEVRAAARVFAHLLAASCPESRELSLAMTNLEQSVFWANASIARDGK